MTSKKQTSPEGGRAAGNARQRASAHTATRARNPPDEVDKNAPGAQGQEVPTAPSGAPDHPPPGLDAAKHAAAQRAAYQAEVMRECLFPTLMADALGYDNIFDSRAYKVYLQRLLDDAGNPADPVERMMLEQLALAHYRIGQLQVNAGQSKGTEATKIYNAAASRLLGEFRRTALALRAYRTHVPEGKSEQPRLKIFKAAQ